MHIYVCGTQRSGTTFTASMLALAPGTGPLFEPLNPLHPDRDKPLFLYYFQYLGSENEGPFLPLLETWGPGLRLVIKEPTGIFAAEWMADRLGMTPVVTIRHPAAFVASCSRLGWRYGVDELLDQPLLMQRYLAPMEEELRAAEGLQDDPILQLALLWKAVYGVVDDLRRGRPDWCYVRHEDLSRNPMEEFEKLYARLGLEMTPRAREGIREHTSRKGDYAPPEFDDIRRDSARHVRDWERLLEPEDIARIRRITEPVAERFYDAGDW